MVATWSIAASSTYYAKHGAYYLGGNEPSGRWYAPAGDLGLVDGSEVDANLFERLFEALDAYGKSMLSTKGGKLQRSSAFDITFSAPRSVSLAWGLASNETKRLIEAAQERAVRSALSVVEQEATFARRGKNGTTIEKVALNVAIFQHGESASSAIAICIIMLCAFHYRPVPIKPSADCIRSFYETLRCLRELYITQLWRTSYKRNSDFQSIASDAMAYLRLKASTRILFAISVRVGRKLKMS
jgi:hypothetical protein